MNNQKDTEKTSSNQIVNNQGQSTVSIGNPLISNTYHQSNKKTEKLVTALYMVTDCMDTDDALKGKLRLLGVELLSDMYKLSTLEPMDKDKHISSSLSRVREVISFIEIAHTIGFISDMNTHILKREFTVLIAELESYKSKDKHFTFALDESMFNVPEEFISDTKDYSKNSGIRSSLSVFESSNTVKDISKQIDKRTTVNPMSLIKKYPMSNLNATKIDRSERVISVIKSLVSKTGKPEISIKDISSEFTDCSEKTIQRELNDLVSKGQIKKSGAKRWSRYQIA